MKKLLVGGAVILAGFAGTASAAVIKWDTEKFSSSTTDSCSNGWGNSCLFDKGGDILQARAYSTSNDNGLGVFEKATINVFAEGIGVRNRDQSNESSSPEHAVDGKGRDDLVVFEFYGPGYMATGFEIGWKQGDSDIRAWIGGESLGEGYDFTGERFSDLAALGFTLVNFNNVGVDTFKSFNTDIVGRYVIFAPQRFNTNGYDNKNDYFKISQIRGVAGIVVNPPDPDPQNPVSEPGTVALFGIALAGLWANRRRKS
jgi:hypothetical protein